jgi:hypothetical protein
MNSRLILGMLAVIAVFGNVPPVVDAQESVAEVRTWGGQSWSLRDATFDVYYTLIPANSNDSAAPSTGSGTQINITGQSFASRALGTLQSEYRNLESGAQDPTQGRRQRQSLTVVRQGSEIQVPVASIALIQFSRAPIANSPLPPYVAGDDFRYAAVIVLLDGSTLEAESVNLGTTILRGVSPQGRVDIPWREVEQVRLAR